MPDAQRIWLGVGPAAQRVRGWVERVAPLDATVLLLGETGTGKGVLARELHDRSRRGRPFVHVDLAALSVGLLESELFGHERGAFTGASERRPGRLEAAAGGTLFLDEIGELPASGQVRLLRVLQDRVFERVGSTRPLPLEARVVAATNVDLARSVARGLFRRDLYHRLDVLSLVLPPLRERPEDLPLLVADRLATLATARNEAPRTCTRELLRALADRCWPGNVRELHNLLERMATWTDGGVLDEGDLERAEDLGSAVAGPIAVGASEHEHVARVLRATGGNVSRAARRLGVPRTTLRRRIRRAGLQDLIPRD